MLKTYYNEIQAEFPIMPTFYPSSATLLMRTSGEQLSIKDHGQQKYFPSWMLGP